MIEINNYTLDFNKIAKKYDHFLFDFTLRSFIQRHHNFSLEHQHCDHRPYEDYFIWSLYSNINFKANYKAVYFIVLKQ